jgi:glycosyltransferase involved in cell wall biosynthesis
VIGFEGSLAHYENLLVLEDVIPEILEKYPKVEFHYFGDYPIWDNCKPNIKKRIKPIRKLQKGMIRISDLQEWPRNFAKAGFDICVAPLADNLFNRAKSNLRYLEHSTLRIPTIASNVMPYRCIKDGIDGFIAYEHDDWIKYLSQLIENEKLRKKIGENSFKRIQKDYNMQTNAKLWVKFAQEVCQKYHQSWADHLLQIQSLSKMKVKRVKRSKKSTRKKAR